MSNTENKPSLFEQVKALNIPFDNWCSDLYIPVNEQTKELIANYEFKCNVRTFTSQIDKKQWYDVPFAYRDYYKKYRRV